MYTAIICTTAFLKEGLSWASTFLDVIRSSDELGRFCTVTDGVIFHNTFMASDYGYLDFETHLPRPNYWLALLWNRLMGSKVYDSGQEIREGFHCYVHSRKDGKKGYVYVNNSPSESALVELPSFLLLREKCRKQEPFLWLLLP